MKVNREYLFSLLKKLGLLFWQKPILAVPLILFLDALVIVFVWWNFIGRSIAPSKASVEQGELSQQQFDKALKILSEREARFSGAGTKEFRDPFR